MELTIQKSILPAIHANFTEVKEYLSTKLGEYKMEVTVENIKQAKDAATEINKVQKEIKALGKQAADLHQKPINEFKEKIKELAALCEDARQGILSQVRIFEDARRLEAQGKILEYFDTACELKGLRDEYKARINVHSTVSLTALTSKGELNKKTKDAVDLLIANDFAAQQQADLEKAEREKKAAALKAEQDARVATARAETREETLKEVQGDAEVKEEQKELTTAPMREVSEKAPVGKSTYRLTLEFDFIAAGGANHETLYSKILPMIMEGKLEPQSHEIREIV